MEAKLKYIRLITIGNNFIGSFAGILGVLGLINVFTESSWGLGTRGSNSSVLSITSGEEVFFAFLFAAIAGIYYLSLDRIQDDDNLKGLFYYVIDASFKRFLFLAFLISCLIMWIAELGESLGEIILSSIFFSFLTVVHLIVISSSFFSGFVLKFSSQNIKPTKSSSAEEKLIQLNELRGKGLISEEEYNKKRTSIVNDL